MSEAAVAHGHAPAHHGHPSDLDISKFGMWLFLASEIMFFAGFIGAYIVLRMSDTTNVFKHGQEALNWKLAAVNTVVLIFSSLTMALAVAASKKGETNKIRLYLALTLACAFGFLGIKYVEYGAKLHQHPEELTEKQVQMVDSIKDGFAAMTVEQKGEYLERLAHAGDLTEEEAAIAPKVNTAHGPSHNIFYGAYYLLTGFHGLHVIAGIIALFIVLGVAGKFTPKYNTPVEVTGLYWHLVDLVWIFLFPMVYLI